MSPSRPVCLPVLYHRPYVAISSRRHSRCGGNSLATTTLLSCNFWLLTLAFPKASATPWPVGRAYRRGFRDLTLFLCNTKVNRNLSELSATAKD